MKKTIAAAIAVVAFVISARAEKVNLEIYASRFDSIPIGVVDFKQKTDDKLTFDQPWRIIANDFDLCGRFIVVSRPVFDSAAFMKENIGIYIDGEYTLDPSVVAFTCYVNDVQNHEHLLVKEYKCAPKVLRKNSHRFCNELYELLFGDRGIFETRILYIHEQGHRKNVWIMDFDGFNQLPITKGKVLNLFPAFAGTSSMIWTAYFKGKPDIYKALIFGKKRELIAASRGIQVSPSVSPVDGTIVYASSKNGNLDIYTCNPDGSGKRKITANWGVETAPCWSPSGYQIAFTSDRTGNPQIFVMDADGANQKRITYLSRYSDSPSWSPRGDKIAFTSMNERGKLDIWTVHPDGSGEVRLTSLRGHNEYPTWSPDGNLIGFINRWGGTSNFYIMKGDGERVKKVTSSGNVQMPDWSGF
ncbi:MAG: PD40 domain-containing protein [Chitinispirillaceae bacterium]|nr:PD40 domain-containing protein [Chitinispirillaceae bacterium]